MLLIFTKRITTLKTLSSVMKSLIFVLFLASIKAKDFDLNRLLIGLVSYKLTENFSIKELVNG